MYHRRGRERSDMPRLRHMIDGGGPMPTGMALMARVATAAGALLLLAASPVLGQDASPPASPVSPTPGVEAWGEVPFEAGLRDPYGASRMTAVSAGPRGIVAIGTSPTGAAAWHSVDGLTWQRAIPPRSWTSRGPDDRYPSLEDVVATDGGFVVVGTERDGPKAQLRQHRVGLDLGGRAHLAPFRSRRGPVSQARHRARWSPLRSGRSGRTRSRGAVWASDDAIEWEQVFTAPDGGDVEVIVSDGQTIVAGSVDDMA